MKLTVKIAKKLLEHAGYKVSLNESELLTEMAFEKREIQHDFKNNIDNLMQMIAFSSDSEIENYCYSFWKE